MTSYTHFIGIDIGKFDVVVASSLSKKTNTFENSSSGFKDFYKAFHPLLKSSLIVLETTGGYEKLFLTKCVQRKLSVHRANTRHVHAFIRSWGVMAKTDGLDALNLARYGQERQTKLPLYRPKSKNLQVLEALAQRRSDLVQMLAQEKNRLQAPALIKSVQASCMQTIHHLQVQIEKLNQEIDRMMEQTPELHTKRQILETVPGIGPIIGANLAILLPELGELNRRQIASLAGVAPHAYDSGMRQGLRRTKGGRKAVRNLLFLAALTACRSKGRLGDMYRRLLENGKKKMVALTALMRKILIIANARIKESLSMS